MDNNIQPINTGCTSFRKPFIDEEYKAILRKMYQYGIKPTGNKATDKALLHQFEYQQALKENAVTTKFLTVSTAEQEKIQAKKKEKREENNPELKQDSTNGQDALGEQIMFAIEWKKKKKD